MTYDEESELAEQVRKRMQAHGMVQIRGHGYSVNRHGRDLRFNQKTDLHYGEVGRYLIVSVIGHQGGWVTALVRRPPGEYWDERAAQAARTIVERQLAGLGLDVGTSGMEGRKLSRAEIERDVAEVLATPAPVVTSARRRARTRRAR